MHPLRWMFELVDGISGPAKRIGGSLNGVRGGMAKSIAGVKSMVSSLGTGLAKFGLVAQGAEAVGGALKSVASEAFDLGKFVVDSASFKRNTLAAFELMEGSADKARETWDTIKAFSDKTPFETADVMEQFKQLRGAGYSTAQVQNVLSGVFDVASMQGGKGKESAARIVETLAKLKGTDRADGEILKTISEASGGGVNIGDIYSAIGAARKVSKDQAKALVASGKVGGDETTKAVLSVIQTKIDKGGALGTAMQKFGSGSFEGQVSTLKSRFASLFEDVNISPIIAVFASVNNALSSSSESGQRLRLIFNTLGEKMGKGLGEMFSAENVASAISFAADALDTMYGIVVAAWPYIEAIGGGVWDGLKAAIGPIVDGFKEAFGGGDSGPANPKILEGLIAIGKAVGWLVGKAVSFMMVFVKIGIIVGAVIALAAGYIGDFVSWFTDTALPAVGEAIIGIGDFFSEMWTSISTFFGGLWDSFTTIGSDMVDGIWEGLKSAWRGFLQDFSDLVDLLPDTVKKALGIASPSKVFAELGRYTMKGFAVGIQSEAANTNATVATAVEVPTLAATKAAPGRATATIGSVTIAITIDGRGKTEDTLRDLAEQCADVLPGVLEAALADVA